MKKIIVNIIIITILSLVDVQSFASTNKFTSSDNEINLNIEDEKFINLIEEANSENTTLDSATVEKIQDEINEYNLVLYLNSESKQIMISSTENSTSKLAIDLKEFTRKKFR